MLEPGDPAVDFDLPRPTTDGVETYRLSAAAREGPVVVAFYPVADVDGAGQLLGDLAAVDWRGVSGGVAVLGVGVGPRDAHDRIAAAVDVPFPLLLDDGYFADAYDVLEPVGGDAVRVTPTLYLVDQSCVVSGAWSLAGDAADESDDVLDEVRDAVAAL